ncbi:septum formation initiator family protein [Candidatus Oleimmundimicrobium sp.]|uniref:FtsB family cell division protein n=1 Tax=Candidatus Oleimmundimicrobium sp. TaxID=3060597 RepID=UPI0027248147|nr:septum formation initiator family protein [Candidatus Oleimmundimicrobium sp.]MDO8886292.1 septum formation initiator family protein [Candidatus Oleimmundimicrobium sp.]
MRPQVCKAKSWTKSKNKKKRELRRKKRKSFKMNSQLLLYCVLLIVIGFWVSQPIIQGVVEKRKISALQEDIFKIQKENETLEKEISALNTDDNVEMVARGELGLIKPGEESYIVVPEDEGEEETSQALDESYEEENSEEPIWRQILEFITNFFNG